MGEKGNKQVSEDFRSSWTSLMIDLLLWTSYPMHSLILLSLFLLICCTYCFFCVVWDIPGNEKGHKGLLGWKVNFFLPPTNERKDNWYWKHYITWKLCTGSGSGYLIFMAYTSYDYFGIFFSLHYLLLIYLGCVVKNFQRGIYECFYFVDLLQTLHRTYNLLVVDASVVNNLPSVYSYYGTTLL